MLSSSLVKQYVQPQSVWFFCCASLFILIIIFLNTSIALWKAWSWTVNSIDTVLHEKCSYRLHMRGLKLDCNCMITVLYNTVLIQKNCPNLLFQHWDYDLVTARISSQIRDFIFGCVAEAHHMHNEWICGCGGFRTLTYALTLCTFDPRSSPKFTRQPKAPS